MLDEFDLIQNLAIALGAGLAGGLAVCLLKQSGIIGYLLAGVIVGPHALRLIEESDEIRVLATIGVVLLLFTLGVKFSLRELMRVRKVAIGGGILQLALTTGLGMGVAALLGWSFSEVVTFGFIIAISSTMDTVVAVEGKPVVRSIMKMTLSSDHRIIDGTTGAAFINSIKDKLEDVELWKSLTS